LQNKCTMTPPQRRQRPDFSSCVIFSAFHLAGPTDLGGLDKNQDQFFSG
jgi:hypothetical protein